MKEKTIDDIKIGDRAFFSKTITETDLILFAGITGDFAPHHVDAEYAKTTMFGQRIVHGMLTAGIANNVITQLVSPGSLALSTEIKYLKPVRIGDTITFEGEIEDIIKEKKIVKIKVACKNQKGEIVIDIKAVNIMRIH
ncbi:enoyl-CoA hydratase [Thermoanaerobacteraceae bacterium SP2]|nr:enoyl-CoA hydratase [Thermoanaerobacteraceae bacterium SP2]